MRRIVGWERVLSLDLRRCPSESEWLIRTLKEEGLYFDSLLYAGTSSMFIPSLLKRGCVPGMVIGRNWLPQQGKAVIKELREEITFAKPEDFIVAATEKEFLKEYPGREDTLEINPFKIAYDNYRYPAIALYAGLQFEEPIELIHCSRTIEDTVMTRLRRFKFPDKKLRALVGIVNLDYPRFR